MSSTLQVMHVIEFSLKMRKQFFKDAIVNNDLEMLEFLLEIGYECEYPDIINVCQYGGSVNALKLFIAHGGGNQVLNLPNGRTQEDNIPILMKLILTAAVSFTNLEIVEYILSLKVIPLVASIAHNAIRCCDLIMVECLLKHGVPIDNTSIFLAYAIKGKNTSDYYEMMDIICPFM